ncbi:MAG: DNA/RNA nuclease SfsA [Candidatus Nucleicultricaceae bacterium]
MKFSVPPLHGKLLKRYKRFLADVQLDSGALITAHCPNSGAMLGVSEPGSSVYVTPHPDDGKRKLLYTLECVNSDGVWVGINTFRPNMLVEEAIHNGTIQELLGYSTLKREVRYGLNSRIDLLLSDPSKPDCYVEIKNAQLKREEFVQFPDSVTERGAKHLNALSDMVNAGARAVVVYVAQREDVNQFSVAADIDPTYGRYEQDARNTGVEFLCYGCRVTAEEIVINRSIKVF